ncbi:unnamed protein product [Tuber melanosporum]|uniref:(Perigord truffle) hypothetical protein n=1 Tax=Tuber melanosporum (strain Mel28) TaxID=656061 RepID=D5GJP9_TUBMM|nr:uncharacterized protein GSTUM_00009120001 [Tuber melanosporum]CAZ84742.1 unnamed protein product [Tuber melanosporum]
MFTQFRLPPAEDHRPEDGANANSRTTHHSTTTITTRTETTSSVNRPRGSRGVRRPLSCATCIKKKTKCDRKLPCGTCVNRGDALLCSFGPQGTALRQAKECAELRQRLRKLESMVQEIRASEKATKAGSPPNGGGGGVGNSDLSSFMPPPLSPATSASSTLSPPGHHDEDDRDSKNGRPNASLEYDTNGGASYVDQSRWDCVLLEMGDLKASIRNISEGEVDGEEASAPNDGNKPQQQTQLQQQPQVEKQTPASYSLFTAPTNTDAGEFILMLPPKPLIDYLVSRYVEVFASLFHVLHEPSFMEDYRAFWESPKDVSLSWLALLFVVLGVGVMSLDDNDAVLKEHLHMSTGRGLDLSSYVKRYCDLAMRCLVADRFMESYRLSTIQCLILLIYSKNHSNDGGMSWALLGLTANIAAGLGCHKDGANLGLDPVETEQRRRCWAAILMLDAFQASAFGRPSMMRATQFETRLPLDVNDVDITRTGVREASSRPTQMTYLNLKFRLLSITSKIYEKLFGAEKPDYSTIVELDQEIRNEQKTWPGKYSADGPELNGLKANDQVHWYILHGHLHQMFLLLHRPYFHKSSAENHPVAPDSRRQCIESATSILEIYNILNTKRKYQPYRWYINGLATFHAFHAVIVVSVDLLSMHDPSQSSTWEAFKQVHDHFSKNAPRSSIATKTLPVVNFLRKKITGRIKAVTPPPPPVAPLQPPTQAMDTTYTHHPTTAPPPPHRPPQQNQMYKDTSLYPTHSFAGPHHQNTYHLESITASPTGIIPESMYYQAAAAATIVNPGFVAAAQLGDMYPQDMELDNWLQGSYMHDLSQWVSPGAFCWDDLNQQCAMPLV